MANNDLTDVKIALAKLEQSNILNTEASLRNTDSHTQLNLQLTELIGTIKESNVKYDLMIAGSVSTANATSESLNKHLEFANPILTRTKKTQDNVDKMISGIFSKVGLIILGAVILGISTYLGITPK